MSTHRGWTFDGWEMPLDMQPRLERWQIEYILKIRKRAALRHEVYPLGGSRTTAYLESSVSSRLTTVEGQR